MAHTLHIGDLPSGFAPNSVVAVDTESMGLHPARDRLCLVQLSNGDGTAHIVQLPVGSSERAPVLEGILSDPGILKVFHFARADIAMLRFRFGVGTAPVYCTKIASRLCRTYTREHGLKAVLKDCVGIEIAKEQQASDWGSDRLTQEQVDYAASDVLHLHEAREELNRRLEREGRMELAEACFEFLPVRARLDLEGWPDKDIFAH